MTLLLPLFLCEIDVTGRCNLSCRHCRRSFSNIDLHPLTNIIKKISQLQPRNWVISGGEPFLRTDLIKILELIRFLTPDATIGVTTNGTIMNEKIARKLTDLKIRVQISLDGDKKFHDFFRGVNGTYEKAVKTAKLLLENGVDVHFRMTLVKENSSLIDHILDLVATLDMERLEIRSIIPFGRARRESVLKPREYRKLISEYYEKAKDNDILLIGGDPCLNVWLKERFKYLKSLGNVYDGSIIAGCLTGISVIYIDTNGNIGLCPYLPHRIGNINKGDLKRIIVNSKILRYMKNWRNKLKGRCGECKFKYVCGGCRAFAYSYSKDLLAEDPRSEACPSA